MVDGASILQVFNVPDRPVDCVAHRPNPRKHEPLLAGFGFRVSAEPLTPWPWNPFRKRHNAVAGLDPLRALRILLARRRVACVVGHLESVVLLLLLRRLFRFQPLVVIWEVPWSPGWRYREMLTRLGVLRADLCIVFSSSQIGLLHTSYGARVRACFIPFCVDTEYFQPLVGTWDERSILSVGQDAGRDFQLLIHAVADLDVDVTIRTGIDLDLPRGGTARIVQLRKALPFDEYRELYRHAAMVVVTANETPNASGVTSLLEAMAMGKPVIVSGTAALQDYLPPPGAGLVVPVGDEHALQAAIRRLLDHPEEAREMGRRARDFVQARFSPQAHFEAFGKTIAQLTE